MGCLSSKMASKNSRFDGERSPHKGCNGSKVMDGELISIPKGDQLVSLLYSSEKVVPKPKSEEQQGKKKLGDVLGKLSHSESHDSVNAWELMAGLEEEEEEDENKNKKGKESLRDGSLQIEVIEVDDFLGSSSDEADEGEGRDGREDSKLESRSHLVAPGGEMGGAVCRDSFSCDSMRFIVKGDKEWRRLGEATREEVGVEAPLRVSSFRFVRMGGGLHGKKVAGRGEEEGELSGDDTPTFGSYIRSRVRERMEEAGEVEDGDGEGGGGVLHEELMAQLEEAMKQLRDEEEHVVMKIVEDFLDQVYGTTFVN